MASPNRRGGIHDLGRHAYTKACPMLACLSGDLTSRSRKNSNWEGSHEVEEERSSISPLLGYSSHEYNFERRSSLINFAAKCIKIRVASLDVSFFSFFVPFIRNEVIP